MIKESINNMTSGDAVKTAGVVAGGVLSFFLIKDLVEKAIDHCRDKVKPVTGSVLYCDLFYGRFEHSGIYIGDDRIVHLNGKGRIEIVNSDEFIAKWSYDHNIYVSCHGSDAVGSEMVAERAYHQVGKQRRYNFVTNNCHKFSAGCLLNNFENEIKFLSKLKKSAEKEINASTWRIWDR